MFFLFKKSKSKKKRNKGGQGSYKSCKRHGITNEQMAAISNTIIHKKRLVVYAENM